MKRIKAKHYFLRIILVLVICYVCLAPLTALAAEGSTGDLQWQLSAGTLTISGSGPMPDYTDANMPPWYDSAEAITRIVVREGVTSVGDLAFYGCSNATGVLLPTTVTSIGNQAFKNCYSIGYVGFPSGLTSIGEAAFESCESLNGVLLPPGLQRLGDYAFNRCTSLSSITIPASVTKFGMVTFAYCTSLVQAVILCPVTKLPDWTFYGCTALQAVSIPENVSQIGDKAFRDCSSLSSIYYSGDASERVSEALEQESSVSDVVIIENEQPTGQTTIGFIDKETGADIVINVSTSENATIVKTQKTDYVFTINGELATVEEVEAAEESDDIQIIGTSNTTIDATVYTPEGWDEMVDTVVNMLIHQGDTQEKIQVQVQLPGTTIESVDLKKLAGKDTTLSISTGSGSTWVVDQSMQTKKDFGKASYELDFTVTKLEENQEKIESNTVYQVDFPSDVDFSAMVGVNLKVGNAYQYATLYQKDRSEMTELQTVVVDSQGCAWFALANVEADVEYYVAINAEGVDTSEALVPQSLYNAYGIDPTLMDAMGTKYQITGRASRWGITIGQFSIYVAIAVAMVVLVVSLVMITMNKISRSRMKYAALAEAEKSIEIDEEAIRMEVMREMLGQVQNKKDNE